MGAQFDNPAQIAIWRGTWDNSVLHDNFTVSIANQTTLEPIPPECVSALPNVCVQRAIYVFERDLPILAAPQSYFIVYQRCCRNETIKNIVLPGDVGATYYVELSAFAQQQNNNSPQFNNFPPIIICNNFPINFDHSATDEDGDQIVYSFCAPYSGGGKILSGPGLTSCEGAIPTPPCSPPFDNVPFAVPTYTPGNPMGGNPQVTINPVTGLISGKPSVLGQFVLGVCAKEYRNGQLISTLKRDFQFNVADCEPTVNANIKEDTLLGVQQFVVTSCGSNKVTFVNQSVQKQFIDFFEWRFNLGNGQTVSDNTNWDATVVFPDTGHYSGILLLNPNTPCGDTAFINVNIFPEVKADFAYSYDTCVAGPVIFTDKSYGDATVQSWNWRFGVPNGLSNLKDPTFEYDIPGNHPVKLTVTDRNRCKDDTTAIINYFPAPPVIIIKPDAFIGCVPQEIFFDNLSKPIDESYKIVWDFGDGDTSMNVISPTHLYDSAGVYDIHVAITSPLGCFIEKNFQDLIRMEPRPVANFSCDPDTLLSQLNNTVSFTDLSIDAARWNWQMDRFKTLTEQNPTFTFPDTGQMRVRLIVTHARGCQDSMFKVLDIRPETRWFMPNAFTPNGDSNNDLFFGKGVLEGVTDFKMAIWNRWGELVFETSDPNEGWNGRQQNTGGMSPAGVYVYVVNFKGPRGELNEFKGYATLVR
ncbi:MAG: gliding motility-associated C-terminal domain-containing protein [Saprospiraceae bacterium]|nr:gliding motility-associated C-terminal domain-containing protein [Saprospiraceae bacterium]